MKVALQFAMPVEFRALPGTEALEPFETVSGVPFYDLGEGLTACVGVDAFAGDEWQRRKTYAVRSRGRTGRRSVPVRPSATPSRSPGPLLLPGR